MNLPAEVEHALTRNHRELGSGNLLQHRRSPSYAPKRVAGGIPWMT